MIEIKYRDRLGNKLFQYCLGRIIAENLNYKLKCEEIKGFKNIEQLPGIGYSNPRLKYIKHEINLDEILNDHSPRKIILHGWFQKYRYYKDYKNKIKEWLYLEPINNTFNIDQDDIVVHIRLGDYYHIFKRTLSYDYYSDAIKIIREKHNGRIFICTDDLNNNKYLKYFSKYNPIFVNYNEVDSLRFIKLFNNIVLSMSTFSWWGGFLSDAKNIVYPILGVDKGGCWGRNTDIDLRVDEDRYIYLYNQKTIGDL